MADVDEQEKEEPLVLRNLFFLSSLSHPFFLPQHGNHSLTHSRIRPSLVVASHARLPSLILQSVWQWPPACILPRTPCSISLE